VTGESSEPVGSPAHRWWWRVAAITAVGLLVRTAHVLLVARDLPLGAHATRYLLVGGSLREGLGFLDPETLFSTGEAVPTATFPPLYPAFLTAVQ